MKVKIHKRPLRWLGGPCHLRTSGLNWKELKFDQQQLKEAINDADYAMSRRRHA